MEEERVVEAGLPEFVHDPIGTLQRHWQAVVAALAVGLVATAVVTLSQTPLYSARATVMLVSQRIPEDFVRPTIEEDASERIDALVAEALSIRSLTQLIEAHELYPELRASLALSEVIAEMRSVISVELEPQLMTNPAPRPQAQAQTTHILAIGFSHTDPDKAATVADALAGLITDAGVRTRTERAGKTTEFLRRELTSAEASLRGVSREISQFQQEHRGELPSELEASLRRLERLQQQRQSLATQIGEAETRLAIATVQSPDTSPEAQLEQARADLARERAVNTETHPNVAALRRRTEALERMVNDTSAGPPTSREYLARRREINDLRADLAATEGELQELDVRVARTPARAEQLAGLEQRQKVVEETHLDLLRKVKEAEIAESLEQAQQGERVVILDHAVPPTEPDRPRWKLAVRGVVASLGLALCAGVLLEWRDPVLTTVRGVESASGLTVLGTVPRIT